MLTPLTVTVIATSVNANNLAGAYIYVLTKVPADLDSCNSLTSVSGR